MASTVRLKLAPSGAERIVAGRVRARRRLCHQPCSPTTTRGSSWSLSRARARMPPAGVSTATQSPGRDAARGGRVGMQLHLRIRRALAQARQARDAGSGRTASAWRRSAPAGSAPRGRAVPPGRSAARRSPAAAHSRARETSPTRARPCATASAKPRGLPCASGSACLAWRVCSGTRTPAGCGAQLLQRHAARRQLVAIGRVDVAVPELLAEAEPHRRDRR